MHSWLKCCPIIMAAWALGGAHAFATDADDPCLQAGIAPKLVVDERGITGLLSWDAVSGAQGYRVRILRRVPEGPRVEEWDSRTALPEYRWSLRPQGRPTKVRYSVQALCTKGHGALWTGHALIGARTGCDPIVLGAIESPGSAKRTVSWNALPGTQAEVTVYDREGRLLSQSLSLGRSYELSGADGTQTVMLRRVCGDVTGPPLFYLLR